MKEDGLSDGHWASLGIYFLGLTNLHIIAYCCHPQLWGGASIFLKAGTPPQLLHTSQ